MDTYLMHHCFSRNICPSILFWGVTLYIYSNPEKISLYCEEPTDINWSLEEWGGGANSPTKLKLWPWTHLRLFNRQKRCYNHADSPQDADIYSTTMDIWWICKGLWWIMPDDSPFTTLQSSSQCYLSSSGWFSIGKPRGKWSPLRLRTWTSWHIVDFFRDCTFANNNKWT